MKRFNARDCPTVCVREAWQVISTSSIQRGGHFDTASPVSTSVDNTLEQEKLEASLYWCLPGENAQKWRRLSGGRSLDVQAVLARS